jgi:hypothetical protein
MSRATRSALRGLMRLYASQFTPQQPHQPEPILRPPGNRAERRLAARTAKRRVGAAEAPPVMQTARGRRDGV